MGVRRVSLQTRLCSTWWLHWKKKKIKPFKICIKTVVHVTSNCWTKFILVRQRDCGGSWKFHSEIELNWSALYLRSDILFSPVWHVNILGVHVNSKEMSASILEDQLSVLTIGIHYFNLIGPSIAQVKLVCWKLCLMLECKVSKIYTVLFQWGFFGNGKQWILSLTCSVIYKSVRKLKSTVDEGLTVWAIVVRFFNLRMCSPVCPVYNSTIYIFFSVFFYYYTSKRDFLFHIQPTERCRNLGAGKYHVITQHKV